MVGWLLVALLEAGIDAAPPDAALEPDAAPMIVDASPIDSGDLTPIGPSRGCGCGAASPSGSLALAVATLFAARRRRR